MSLKLADVLSLSCYVRFFNVPYILTTWGRRLYFLSEEMRAADFYRPWKSIASARFEPANLRFTGKDDNRYTTMRYVIVKIFTENFRLIFLLILKGYWAIIYPNVSFGTDIRGFLQFNTACFILLYCNKFAGSIFKVEVYYTHSSIYKIHNSWLQFTTLLGI
jgi:hypothetical protein